MKADAGSWKLEPFTTGLLIPYENRFSEIELAKLQEGLIPESMDDKWFIHFDDPHLFFHRSWTGKSVYKVRLVIETNGASVGEAFCIADLVNSTGAAYQAMLLDFLIDNLLLGKAKPFPIPDGVVEPVKGILQHSISGTGYRQIEAKPHE